MDILKKSALFFIAMVSLYFFNSYFIQKKEITFKVPQTTPFKPTQNFPLKVSLPVSKSIPINKVKTKFNKVKTKLTKVKDFLQKESILIGSVDSSPNRSLKRLKNQALLLKEKDFQYLLKESLNLKQDGDRRFLSVYLLSLSQNIKTLPYLKKIISLPINKSQKVQHLYEQELVIKMKAIEGFLELIKSGAHYEKQVESLLKQQEDPFLVKFIRNSM